MYYLAGKVQEHRRGNVGVMGMHEVCLRWTNGNLWVSHQSAIPNLRTKKNKRKYTRREITMEIISAYVPVTFDR